jgi:hypothetical protein
VPETSPHRRQHLGGEWAAAALQAVLAADWDVTLTPLDTCARVPRARCATRWKDLEAFEELLVERLAGH